MVFDINNIIDKLKCVQVVCNYPAFFKEIMCKHVVSMPIRLNSFKPSTAKNVKIDAKKDAIETHKSKGIADSMIFFPGNYTICIDRIQ